MAHPKAGRPKEGPPVKYFAAILESGTFDRFDVLTGRLEAIFGKIDYRGHAVPFDMTDYYEDEMGTDISRRIVSFAPLAPATDIVRLKLETAVLEEELSEGGNRKVNIDTGYIDFFKAVLASFKEGPQKIYLGEGVYADPVLTYQDGKWSVFPWTFPDFKKGLYIEDFNTLRKLYRVQRREA